MKLSTRARYAMHLMLEVAKRPDGPTSLREVAQRTRISRRYLDQLAVALRAAGLVRGQAGRAGGYRLTRAPRDVAVGEVIEAAIGPINVVECVNHPEACLQSDQCECRAFYSLLNRRIVELFRSVSLADLGDRRWLRCAERELDGRGPCRPCAPRRRTG